MTQTIEADRAQRPAVERKRLVLRSEIETELDLILNRHSRSAQAYGPEFTQLWALIARHLRGGKLLRPVLMLETYDAINRETQASSGNLVSSDDAENTAALVPRAEVVRVAAAIEMLHYAFLLHDDVIDGDTLRRGHSNLIGDLANQTSAEHAACRATHWASTGGILAGDLLLSAVHQIFARVSVPADMRIQLLDLLEHTIIETTAGEFVDVGLGDGVITPDLSTVLAMTTQKTACYSFEMPLRAAAILAGAPEYVEGALSTIGSHLGLAYQLQDDVLSTFGDAEIHGKDAFSDLREGKQTAIICFARMTSAWPSIEPMFGDPELSAEKATQIRDLLSRCGAEKFVLGLIGEQLTAFYEVLADGAGSAKIPAEVRVVLLDLVSRIEGRQS